jgi:hypothetical protein
MKEDTGTLPESFQIGGSLILFLHENHFKLRNVSAVINLSLKWYEWSHTYDQTAKVAVICP